MSKILESIVNQVRNNEKEIKYSLLHNLEETEREIAWKYLQQHGYLEEVEGNWWYPSEEEKIMFGL